MFVGSNSTYHTTTTKKTNNSHSGNYWIQQKLTPLQVGYQQIFYWMEWERQRKERKIATPQINFYFCAEMAKTMRYLGCSLLLRVDGSSVLSISSLSLSFIELFSLTMRYLVFDCIVSRWILSGDNCVLNSSSLWVTPSSRLSFSCVLVVVVKWEE